LSKQLKRPPDDVLAQGGKTATVLGDGDLEFPPQRMGRQDAEVAAMSAPIGRRRTSAAIRSGVGRRARHASASQARRVAGAATRGPR
jgi:hypothetical protein